MSRDMPKSEIFIVKFFSDTKQFLAARSRWTKCCEVKYFIPLAIWADIHTKSFFQCSPPPTPSREKQTNQQSVHTHHIYICTPNSMQVNKCKFSEWKVSLTWKSITGQTLMPFASYVSTFSLVRRVNFFFFFSLSPHQVALVSIAHFISAID